MDIDDILAEALHVAAPQETLDLQELTRAWVAERVAPELLPYPDALIERVLARVRKQIETIEEQTGNMDPKTNFRLIVIQTELERFKFLVRSFLRARVAKIDKYPLHVQQNFAHYLSPSESQYLTAHQTLLASHYQSSFLSQFPNSLQKLDDTQGGISMIDAPDADTAVFCRALRDVGDVIVEGAGIIFQMKRGDIRVVRWSAIRDKVLAGDMELV